MSELLTPPNSPEATGQYDPNETYLISRREVVEKMLPAELLEVRKGILERLNREEADLKMVNEVLEGYGYTEQIVTEVTELNMPVYDANDGTPGSPEHEEDERWIQRGDN